MIKYTLFVFRDHLASLNWRIFMYSDNKKLDGKIEYSEYKK